MDKHDICILAVDDEENNLDLMSRRLERQGYRVVTAESGERALNVVGGQRVDLMVLDVMMPGMDGLEVLETLRRSYSPAELPVIMATARSDSKDVVKALELGANDHVPKPIDFQVLFARIEKELRQKAAASARPAKAGEPTPAEITSGAVIDGKYELSKLIGTGNFGAVYRARHLELDLEVALKLLLPSLTASDESRKRFRQEGVAACRIRHPNAVAITDSGVTESGIAYLAMELLEGISLSQEIREWKRLSPRRANEVLQPICEVLSEAHAAGLVHRDIKPENVFLHQTPRGEVVKLLDFGIAKLVGDAVIQENLTAEGWVLGTPAYLAPERVCNKPYDGRADVYSLGVMLFEMLTGKRPFDGSNNDPMALVMRHVNDQPPTLRSVVPELPVELEGVIARALVKDPAERPDAAELARDFAQIAAAVDGARPSAVAAAARPAKPRFTVDETSATLLLDSAAMPSLGAGGTASGRTSFTRWLRERLGWGKGRDAAS